MFAVLARSHIAIRLAASASTRLEAASPRKEIVSKNTPVGFVFRVAIDIVRGIGYNIGIKQEYVNTLIHKSDRSLRCASITFHDGIAGNAHGRQDFKHEGEVNHE